jgi:hypothetical protein
MKRAKILFIAGLSALFLLVTAGFAAAQVTITATNTEFNKFIIADLGLQGGGKNNNIFQVQFNVGGGQNKYAAVVIKANGETLADGQTDDQPANMFDNDTYSNYEINDDLGGDFEVSDQGDLADTIINTGIVPDGTYTITISVHDAGTDALLGQDTLVITVKSAYVQPIFPVDQLTDKTTLKFQYAVKNLRDQTLSVYRDPSGKNEVKEGSFLPVDVGDSIGPHNVNIPGTGINSVLEDSETYYWGVTGKIRTTHGDELVRGPINRFLFFEDLAEVQIVLLSEQDADAIKALLVKILEKYGSRRDAKSIADYLVTRGILDTGTIGREEIMTILMMMESGDIEPDSITVR